jgi:hypothetical protein
MGVAFFGDTVYVISSIFKTIALIPHTSVFVLRFVPLALAVEPGAAASFVVLRFFSAAAVPLAERRWAGVGVLAAGVFAVGEFTVGVWHVVKIVFSQYDSLRLSTLRADGVCGLAMLSRLLCVLILWVS